MKTVTLVLALSLVASPSLAWNEPDAFAGIKWGATHEEGLTALNERALESKLSPAKCESGRYVGSTQMNCRATLRLGMTMISGDFRFDERGFFWAFGRFPSSDYDALREMFVEKYGTPTGSRSAPVMTRAGEKLTNEALEWIGEKIVIRLTRFGGRSAEGSWEVLTRSEEDKRTERMKAVQQKGKRAL